MERIEALNILSVDESASDADIVLAYQGKTRAIQQAFAEQETMSDVQADSQLRDQLALKFHQIQQQLDVVFSSLNIDVTAAVMDAVEVVEPEPEPEPQESAEEIVAISVESDAGPLDGVTATTAEVIVEDSKAAMDKSATEAQAFGGRAGLMIATLFVIIVLALAAAFFTGQLDSVLSQWGLPQSSVVEAWLESQTEVNVVAEDAPAKAE